MLSRRSMYLNAWTQLFSWAGLCVSYSVWEKIANQYRNPFYCMYLVSETIWLFHRGASSNSLPGFLFTKAVPMRLRSELTQ